MSRAVCSVENSRSESPYLSPQDLAMLACTLATASKSASPTGSGSPPKNASRSASLKHFTALDRPTPRGSNPTTSKRRNTSVGNCCDRYTARSTPEPPGPPGSTSSEPIRLPWLVACTRSRAMSNVLPLSLAAQSCGTGTLAHSNARFGGGDCWRRIPAATSGHGFQAAAPADGRAVGVALGPPAPELGETSGRSACNRPRRQPPSRPGSAPGHCVGGRPTPFYA